jgi:hypothetical protein
MQPEPEPEPEPEPRFEMLFVCRPPLREAECAVALEERYRRQPHPPTEHRVGELWDAKLASNARLFNGTKFRLAGVEWQSRSVASDGGGDGGRRLLLRLGLTDYREYVGTNLRPGAELTELMEAGRASHGGDAQACLSNALGVETMLLTADGAMVLLQRSGAVATHAGLYNGPSGHPEPSHVAGGVELASQQPQPQQQQQQQQQAVLHELFDSVLQEIHQETNIPLDALEQPLLMGAMAELPSSKPDLLFLTVTSLSAKGVEEQFKRGAPDAWESDAMIVRDATTHDAVRRVLEGQSPGSDGAGATSPSDRPVMLTAVTAACLTCYLRAQS